MKKLRSNYSTKSFVFTLALMLSTICLAGNIDTIPANNAAIEYTGRIDFSNPLSPKFSYSGISIRACFSGTSIDAIMNDNIGKNYYNIILDGKVIDTINVSYGKKTYQLAEGLKDTIHEIEIFKRTEQEFGKTQFFGFVVDEGTTLSAVSKRDKLIEFIGNSITCGYGNEGKLGESFGPTTENHYLTYAAITSRNFNARHMAVSKSGIGIYRNYNGPSAGDNECMTNLYTRTFLYDENPKYSFTDRPDLVCINLGTNDFSTPGGDSTRFVNNYFRLIDTIQRKYTMPDILCLVGPMLSGSTLSTVKKYVKFVADSANHKGKGNVYFFELSAQGSVVAIDYHPTIAQHKKNALELTDYIKTLKNWKINPQILNASLLETNHIKVEFNTSMQGDLNKLSGLKITGNNSCIIDSMDLDSSNSKILHAITRQNFAIGEKITLNYTPGTIESTDSIKLGKIDSLAVTNNLSETKFSRGASNVTGTTIMLFFNKSLKNNNSFEGLTITGSKEIAIDSINISNAQINIFLKDTLIKGDSIFVSYTGTSICGIDGILLSTIPNTKIKNSSTHTSISCSNINPVDLYPNPNNSGKFYYRIEKSLVTSNASIDVFNINGAMIYSQKLSNSSGMVDLGGKMSKGSYIFKFVLGESAITRSIIKE